MISTYSIFYYGLEVDSESNKINFDEGSGELTATIAAGLYSLADLCTAVAAAMNAAGDNTYTCTVDRSTRVITITSSASFELLFSSGTNVDVSIAPVIGFALTDTTDDSISGTSAAGSVYEPQFWLQSYVDLEDYQGAASATVNKSASGKVQVQSFGTERFMEANIKWATDIQQPSNGPIKSNATGVDDLRAFMQWAVRKGPIEFMANINDRDTYSTLILESTPENKDGVGYKLRELYDQGTAYYYETGVLKFREVIE